jgi:hypothetical protein
MALVLLEVEEVLLESAMMMMMLSPGKKMQYK